MRISNFAAPGPGLDLPGGLERLGLSAGEF